MAKRYFSKKLARWYEIHQRPLPWRTTNDPYRIWLSEIILQQTRVSQGLPYYEAFVTEYPTVFDLASARERDVLRLWQGLGYYTRARNLHRCAQEVAGEYGGVFPKSYEGLKKLPGIGSYTAAAIASFAYRERVAVVDGNVFRVLARVFGIDLPIDSGQGRAAFEKLAHELLPDDRPDLHNQAIMDFGATCCTPRNPRCEDCPFRNECVAYSKGNQRLLPVKVPKKPSRQRHFYYLVVQQGNKLLMKKRTGRDIWHGLYDFALIEKNRRVKPEVVLEEFREVSDKTKLIQITKPYRHVLSHQTIISRFIVLEVQGDRFSGLRQHAFYTFNRVGRLPKPVLVTRFLKDHYLF